MAPGAVLKGVLGVSCHAQEPGETFKSSLEDIFPLPLSLSWSYDLFLSILLSFISTLHHLTLHQDDGLFTVCK